MRINRSTYKWPGLVICFLLLATVYISQQFNYLHWLLKPFGNPHLSDSAYFVVNKCIRFLLNDSIMVMVIYLLFNSKKYVKLAIGVELFGLLILLPVYFTLKLHFEGTSEISSPLLSFIHRLVINPTLLILLIPAIYYQESLSKE